VPLRDVRASNGREALVSKGALDRELEDRFRAGFEAGQKELREELLRQRTQLLEVQNNVLRSIERTLPTVALQCERDLVLLALEAARRVVQNMPVSAEAVEAAVRAGLSEIQDTASYQVRLHPEDLALLEEVQSPVLPRPGQSRVTCTADPSIARAGCIIQTQHGGIELNREKMFRKLEEAALC
jgi:flagellar biosynthesis/type III secretory pathway protein FliH